MRVTMLGCGTSVGIPSLGLAGWGKCDPGNPRNRRQRCAILVESDGFNILVDAGPDIRNQLLSAGNPRVHAVLVTHTHSDHIAGMDDLRNFYWPDRTKIPVYATAATLDELKRKFQYLFVKDERSPSYFEPSLEARPIEPGDELGLGGVAVKVLLQHHGRTDSLGFVFNGVFGYSTDLVGMPEESFAQLEGLDCWIVEALRETEHQAHAHFDLAFSWIERLKPGRAILTHLGLEADYEETLARCPKGVEPGYDGLVVAV